MKTIKKYPFIFGLLISSLLSAQKLEVEFGKVSREDIKMKKYEKDTVAKAIVLFDIGNSKFYDSDRDYNIQFLRHKRVKIFDKTVTDQIEITIPYYVDGYGKTEMVKHIKAITYTLDNNNNYTETKLDPDNIYDEQINERWHQKKFVFPNVQDGSVIEYKYELESPFHFNLPDWNFQNKIPTVYSEYKANMIPFYEYVMYAQGISKFDYQNSEVSSFTRSFGNNGSYKEYIHTYILKDLPAFKDESYITSVNDYIIKMNFQLSKIHYPTGGDREIISTWPALNKSLLKHDKFGKYIKKSKKYVEDILEEKLNISTLNKNEKAKTIIEYVKNNYIWNNRDSKYTTQSVKDFVATKEGNSADINLFLIAMLNQAGIKAEPIILSTRSHGKIPISYPFDHSSNYVIALVYTENPFLTDATETLLPYNMLPVKCINEKGLLVNEQEDPSWIGLRSNIPSIEKKTIHLVLDPKTLNFKSRVSVQSTFYESFTNRNGFKNDTLKIKEYYTDKIGEINNVETYNYKNKTKPYSMNFVATHTPEILGDDLMIKPFLKLPLSTNHLTQKTRSYPVDFEYLRDNQFQSLVTLPNNYNFSSLPESYHISNDLVDINIDYQINGKTLSATGNYKFKKSIYVANEYARIKSYIDQIVRHFNQPILLKQNL
ncbi:transglutaminase domain-containing protein [Wenyingzhuangia sp. IMCC45467]